MGAPCKLRSSKLGKGIQQTSALLKRRSIIVHGATAKRGSANTPKRWKLRRPHDIWRSNDAPLFVRHAGSGDTLRSVGTIGARDRSQRVSGEIRCKYQRASAASVRRAGRANWLLVEP